MRHVRSRNHFTLIELLVVIAIIAILASMLLPALGNARTRASSTHCMNSLRQVGIAFQMYFAEFDERIPPYADRYCAPPGRTHWYNMLANAGLVGNDVLDGCPVVNRPSTRFNMRTAYGCIYSHVSRCGDYSNQGRVLFTVVKSFGDPSQAAVAMDAQQFPGQTHQKIGYSLVYCRVCSPNGVSGDRIWNGISDRHNNGANVVFLDGHGQWYPITSLLGMNRPVRGTEIWGHYR